MRNKNKKIMQDFIEVLEQSQINAETRIQNSVILYENDITKDFYDYIEFNCNYIFHAIKNNYILFYKEQKNFNKVVNRIIDIKINENDLLELFDVHCNEVGKKITHIHNLLFIAINNTVKSVVDTDYLRELAYTPLFYPNMFFSLKYRKSQLEQFYNLLNSSYTLLIEQENVGNQITDSELNTLTNLVNTKRGEIFSLTDKEYGRVLALPNKDTIIQQLTDLHDKVYDYLLSNNYYISDEQKNDLIENNYYYKYPKQIIIYGSSDQLTCTVYKIMDTENTETYYEKTDIITTGDTYNIIKEDGTIIDDIIALENNEYLYEHTFNLNTNKYYFYIVSTDVPLTSSDSFTIGSSYVCEYINGTYEIFIYDNVYSLNFTDQNIKYYDIDDKLDTDLYILQDEYFIIEHKETFEKKYGLCSGLCSYYITSGDKITVSDYNENLYEEYPIENINFEKNYYEVKTVIREGEFLLGISNNNSCIKTKIGITDKIKYNLYFKLNDVKTSEKKNFIEFSKKSLIDGQKLKIIVKDTTVTSHIYFIENIENITELIVFINDVNIFDKNITICNLKDKDGNNLKIVETSNTLSEDFDFEIIEETTNIEFLDEYGTFKINNMFTFDTTEKSSFETNDVVYKLKTDNIFTQEENYLMSKSPSNIKQIVKNVNDSTYELEQKLIKSNYFFKGINDFEIKNTPLQGESYYIVPSSDIDKNIYRVQIKSYTKSTTSINLQTTIIVLNNNTYSFSKANNIDGIKYKEVYDYNNIVLFDRYYIKFNILSNALLTINDDDLKNYTDNWIYVTDTVEILENSIPDLEISYYFEYEYDILNDVTSIINTPRKIKYSEIKLFKYIGKNFDDNYYKSTQKIYDADMYLVHSMLPNYVKYDGIYNNDFIYYKEGLIQQRMDELFIESNNYMLTIAQTYSRIQIDFITNIGNNILKPFQIDTFNKKNKLTENFHGNDIFIDTHKKSYNKKFERRSTVNIKNNSYTDLTCDNDKLIIKFTKEQVDNEILYFNTIDEYNDTPKIFKTFENYEYDEVLEGTRRYNNLSVFQLLQILNNKQMRSYPYNNRTKVSYGIALFTFENNKYEVFEISKYEKVTIGEQIYYTIEFKVRKINSGKNFKNSTPLEKMNFLKDETKIIKNSYGTNFDINIIFYHVEADQFFWCLAARYTQHFIIEFLSVIIAVVIAAAITAVIAGTTVASGGTLGPVWTAAVTPAFTGSALLGFSAKAAFLVTLTIIQEIIFDNIGTGDELNENDIQEILQDPNGMVYSKATEGITPELMDIVSKEYGIENNQDNSTQIRNLSIAYLCANSSVSVYSDIFIKNNTFMNEVVSNDTKSSMVDIIENIKINSTAVNNYNGENFDTDSTGLNNFPVTLTKVSLKNPIIRRILIGTAFRKTLRERSREVSKTIQGTVAIINKVRYPTRLYRKVNRSLSAFLRHPATSTRSFGKALSISSGNLSKQMAGSIKSLLKPSLVLSSGLSLGISSVVNIIGKGLIDQNLYMTGLCSNPGPLYETIWSMMKVNDPTLDGPPPRYGETTFNDKSNPLFINYDENNNIYNFITQDPPHTKTVIYYNKIDDENNNNYIFQYNTDNNDTYYYLYINNYNKLYKTHFDINNNLSLGENQIKIKIHELEETNMVGIYHLDDFLSQSAYGINDYLSLNTLKEPTGVLNLQEYFNRVSEVSGFLLKFKVLSHMEPNDIIIRYTDIKSDQQYKTGYIIKLSSIISVNHGDYDTDNDSIQLPEYMVNKIENTYYDDSNYHFSLLTSDIYNTKIINNIIDKQIIKFNSTYTKISINNENTVLKDEKTLNDFKLTFNPTTRGITEKIIYSQLPSSFIDEYGNTPYNFPPINNTRVQIFVKNFKQTIYLKGAIKDDFNVIYNQMNQRYVINQQGGRGVSDKTGFFLDGGEIRGALYIFNNQRSCDDYSNYKYDLLGEEYQEFTVVGKLTNAEVKYLTQVTNYINGYILFRINQFYIVFFNTKISDLIEVDRYLYYDNSTSICSIETLNYDKNTSQLKYIPYTSSPSIINFNDTDKRQVLISYSDHEVHKTDNKKIRFINYFKIMDDRYVFFMFNNYEFNNGETYSKIIFNHDIRDLTYHDTNSIYKITSIAECFDLTTYVNLRFSSSSNIQVLSLKMHSGNKFELFDDIYNFNFYYYLEDQVDYIKIDNNCINTSKITFEVIYEMSPSDLSYVNITDTKSYIIKGELYGHNLYLIMGYKYNSSSSPLGRLYDIRSENFYQNDYSYLKIKYENLLPSHMLVRIFNKSDKYLYHDINILTNSLYMTNFSKYMGVYNLLNDKIKEDTVISYEVLPDNTLAPIFYFQMKQILPKTVIYHDFLINQSSITRLTNKFTLYNLINETQPIILTNNYYQNLITNLSDVLLLNNLNKNSTHTETLYLLHNFIKTYQFDKFNNLDVRLILFINNINLCLSYLKFVYIISNFLRSFYMNNNDIFDYKQLHSYFNINEVLKALYVNRTFTPNINKYQEKLQSYIEMLQNQNYNNGDEMLNEYYELNKTLYEDFIKWNKLLFQFNGEIVSPYFTYVVKYLELPNNYKYNIDDSFGINNYTIYSQSVLYSDKNVKTVDFKCVYSLTETEKQNINPYLSYFDNISLYVIIQKNRILTEPFFLNTNRLTIYTEPYNSYELFYTDYLVPTGPQVYVNPYVTGSIFDTKDDDSARIFFKQKYNTILSKYIYYNLSDENYIWTDNISSDDNFIKHVDPDLFYNGGYIYNPDTDIEEFNSKDDEIVKYILSDNFLPFVISLNTTVLGSYSLEFLNNLKTEKMTELIDLDNTDIPPRIRLSACSELIFIYNFILINKNPYKEFIDHYNNRTNLIHQLEQIKYSINFNIVLFNNISNCIRKYDSLLSYIESKIQNTDIIFYAPSNNITFNTIDTDSVHNNFTIINEKAYTYEERFMVYNLNLNDYGKINIKISVKFLLGDNLIINAILYWIIENGILKINHTYCKKYQDDNQYSLVSQTENIFYQETGISQTVKSNFYPNSIITAEIENLNTIKIYTGGFSDGDKINVEYDVINKFKNNIKNINEINYNFYESEIIDYYDTYLKDVNVINLNILVNEILSMSDRYSLTEGEVENINIRVQDMSTIITDNNYIIDFKPPEDFQFYYLISDETKITTLNNLYVACKKLLKSKCLFIRDYEHVIIGTLNGKINK